MAKTANLGINIMFTEGYGYDVIVNATGYEEPVKFWSSAKEGIVEQVTHLIYGFQKS